MHDTTTLYGDRNERAGDAEARLREPRIKLVGAAKKYGSTIAVYPLDLEVKQGEFVVILGPSGCGKTTTLRMMAGLEKPTQGEIYIAGKNVTNLDAGERDVAFVFQMFSLYPHMTVLENVAFPMRAQGLPTYEAQRRAGDMLRRLGIESLASMRPRKLSGGDQQRVGLARALVRQPRVFLMDEPMGALDGGLREEVRETLRAVHNHAKATTVFVTHDQSEAMSLADRIAVMQGGKLIQFDTPRNIYDNPANLFVADFVGSPGMNILSARRNGDLVDLLGIPIQLRLAAERSEEKNTSSLQSQSPLTHADLQSECYLGIRPQNVVITEDGAPGRVEHTQVLGSYNLLSVRFGEILIKAWLPAGIRFGEGERVGVSFLSAGCRWFTKGKAESGRNFSAESAAETGLALPWRTLEVKCLPLV